jgi:dTMP kinase
MDIDLLIEEALGQSLMEKDSLLRLASVAVLHDGKVCLVKTFRAGKWALPGGRAEVDEDIAEAAARELEEETGIEVKPDELVFVGHVHRSKKKVDTIFAIEVEKAPEFKTDKEIQDVKWVPVAEIPSLGFGHNKAVKEARRVVNMSPDERGLLIVFEGIDGSGKSTQVERALDWLEKHDYPHVTTKWNSSSLVKKPIKQAKDRRELSPGLYFLLHAADMTHRYEQEVLPALRRNLVVICDRYWYTGLVRDKIRGIKQELGKEIYRNMRKPDMIFYCEVDPSVAVARLVKTGRLGYYSAGMDLDLAPSREESCVEYERQMTKLYKKVMPGHVTLNMSGKIGSIFDEVKAKLKVRLDKEFLYSDNTLSEAAEQIVDIITG